MTEKYVQISSSVHHFLRSVLKLGNYDLSSKQISIAFTGWILRINFYDTFIVSLCHVCWWWRLAWENWMNIRWNIYCDSAHCVIIASISHSLPNELDSDCDCAIMQTLGWPGPMIKIMHISDHRKGIHSCWGNADFSPGVVFSRKHHKRIWPSWFDP